MDEIRVPIVGDFISAGENLLVGVVPLTEFYAFLRTYESATRDLDRLYEKNVRQFLGTKQKINNGIQQTLLREPERFGLYNNGITLVVTGFDEGPNGWLLTDPNVVNGCQTTGSVWETLHRKLEAGGTSTASPSQTSWLQRLGNGTVVCKIVRVGMGTEAISEITRYTNSQNAVREKDFIALEQDFKTWQRIMEDQYQIYLEIQRGGWESRKVLQKQYQAPHLDLWANAFDLLKVYGAGWMGVPGTAFGRNRDFTPDGSVFKRIMKSAPATEESFGVRHLYAASLVQGAADNAGFGRGADKLARRQSRYLFYFVFIEIIRRIAGQNVSQPAGPQQITDAVLGLAKTDDVWTELVDEATSVIDSYLSSDDDYSIFQEESFKAANNDLNSYLKSEKLGNDRDFSKCLTDSIAVVWRDMARKRRDGSPCLRDRALAAVAKA